MFKCLVAAAVVCGAVARADDFDFAEDFEFEEAAAGPLAVGYELPARGAAPELSDENGEQYEHVRADVRFPPNYKGCYRDRNSPRDLNGARLQQRGSLGGMTPKKCMDYCQKQGYKYAGVQYTYECFCDDDFGRYGRLSESSCNMPCEGDRSRKCGGSWANSVYETALVKPFVGCFKDSPKRVLPYALMMKRNNFMNADWCCTRCAQKGYDYCGTEYAYECFCGKTKPSRRLQRPFKECADPCSGNKDCEKETCGDSWRISVYKTNKHRLGWAYYYGTRASGAGALAVLALVGWRAYRNKRGDADGQHAAEETQALL